MFQNELTYTFEEIPLDIGTSKEAQNIALISGEVDVSYAGVWCDDGRRGHEYEIEAVRLSGPILHDPDVAIGLTTQMGRWVARSIESACHEHILEAIAEDCLPDPDAAYEAQRDAA